MLASDNKSGFVQSGGSPLVLDIHTNDRGLSEKIDWAILLTELQLPFNHNLQQIGKTFVREEEAILFGKLVLSLGLLEECRKHCQSIVRHGWLHR